MATQITFDKIADNIKDQKYRPSIPAPDYQSYPIYPNGHVFDPKKPANWNRKQWEKAKARREKAVSHYMSHAATIEKHFQEDCIKALCAEYNIPEPQAGIVVQHAWEKYHMISLTDTLTAIKDMGRLTAKILKSVTIKTEEE